MTHRWYPEGNVRSRKGMELRVVLGTAERLLGVERYRDRLVEAGRDAVALGATELVVQAALAGDRGDNGNMGSVDEPFVGIVRAALDAVGAADSPERTRLLGLPAVELAWVDGSPDERLGLVAEALSVARRLPDLRAFAEVVASEDEARSVPERAGAGWRPTVSGA